MVAGADSIDDMALLRHGGMGRLFTARVRALDAGLVPARVHLRARPPARRGRLPVPDRPGRPGAAARGAGEPAAGLVLVDVDDTIIEVHGHAKQGAGFGYSGVRGLNALLATVTTAGRGAGDRGAAAAQGLVRVPARREAAGRRRRQDRSPTARQPTGPVAGAGGLGVLRPRPPSRAAVAGGAEVSVTVRMDPNGQGRDRHASPSDAWTTIEYTDAVFDETTGALDLPGRGRRDRRSPRSPPRRRPSRSRAGWSCAASRTSTRQAPSRRAGHPVRHLALPRLLHHHRPRRAGHRRPRTRPTAATRSSSRSTPT